MDTELLKFRLMVEMQSTWASDNLGGKLLWLKR